MKKRALEAAIVLLVLIVCVGAVLKGSRGHLTNHIPVGDDARLALCMLLWDVDAMCAGKSWHDLWQLPCLYPEPNILANSDPFLGGAVVYAPLYFLTGQPIVAFNLWLALIVVLNFTSAYLVARRLLRATVPALFCAVLFTVPYVKFVHIDHLHLWPNFPTPLLFLAAVRMARGSDACRSIHFGWRWPIVGGVCLAAQFYLSMYLGYMAAIMLAIMLATLTLYDPARFRDGRFLGGLAVSAALAGLLLCPLVGPYHWAAQRWGGWIWELTQSQVPGWRNFFTRFDGEQTAWCGFTAIGLFIAGTGGLSLQAIHRPRHLAFWPVASVALVLVLACLMVDQFGSYHFLYRVLPGFRALRCPARWTLLAVWPCSLVGGWALARCGLHRHAPMRVAILGLLVVALGFMENARLAPWVNVHLRDEGFYRQVVRNLPEGPYVDFPLNVLRRPPSNAVFGQRLQGLRAAGWRPTLNLFTGKEPDWLRDLLQRQVEARTQQQAAALMGELRLRGIRYVILHKKEMRPESVPAWRTARTTGSRPWTQAVYEDPEHLVLDLHEAPAEAHLTADPSPLTPSSFALRPTMPLRPGRYRASFDVQTDSGRSGTCEVARLEPETRPLPLLLAQTPIAGPGGRRSLTLEFTVPKEPGPEPVLEFRVIKAGPGALRFYGLTLTSLHERSPDLLAARP
jgi:hypothetical protein